MNCNENEGKTLLMLVSAPAHSGSDVNNFSEKGVSEKSAPSAEVRLDSGKNCLRRSLQSF